MPQTQDYAKFGHVTWLAEVGLDDGFEPHARTVAEREFRSARSKGLAKAFVNATLRGLRNPPQTAAGEQPFYWGSIRRGTYLDTSFDDAEDGRVADATWEPDEDPHGEPVADHAHLTDEGQVLWQADQ
jgi:hypothetical protein